MSYTRTKTTQIAVNYSGSVSYPASQNGGTVSYSGTAYETVHINVYVDTDNFDHRIDGCKQGVDVLTGAVVATKTAHVASIADKARQVGSTIVQGFFKTIQSDLSQQIAELSANTEATLTHLNELAKRCVACQQQMGADYQRICQRYNKIFTELDKELENRIYALDEPTFTLRRTADSLEAGTCDNDSVTMAAVSSREQNRLHSRMSAASIKKRALDTIRRCHSFLLRQRQDESLIEHCLMPGEAGEIYAPVAIAETITAPGAASASVSVSQPLQQLPQNELNRGLSALSWVRNVDKTDAEAIRSHYNSQLGQLSGASEHDRRVRDYMTRLFNLSATKAPSKN